MTRYLFKKINGLYLKYFSLLFITSFLAVIGVMIPKLSGYFIDNLINYKETLYIYKFVVTIAVIALVQILLFLLLTILKTNISSYVSFYIRQEKMSKFSNKNIEYIENIDIPELSQILFADSEVLSNFFTNFFSLLLTSIITTVVIIGIMINMNLTITIYLLGMILIYFFYLFFIKNKLYHKELKLKNENTEYFGKITNFFLSIKLIKFFNKLQDSLLNIKNTFISFKKTLISYQLTAFFFMSGDVILSTLSLLIIFIIGGKLYIINEISIGDITIFMSYSSMLFAELKKFSDYYSQYVSAKVSYNRIETNFFEEDSSKNNGQKEALLPVKELLIKDLSFEYKQTNDIKVFGDSRFKPGYLYAITGDNGSGKTTFLNLISGLYSDRYKGIISINDVNMNKIAKEFYTSKIISYVTQEPLYYFGESLEKNLNVNSVNSAYVDYLMRKLNISYSVLSNSLSSNNNLSGGEYQKLNIIRAFSKQFEILLLDEPTNHLDDNSINQLIMEIIKIKKNKIIIIATHDKRIISYADVLIKM
jgi:ABC-type bacteriocin/lantibiotic exporter with double-glycine peptidase domain